MAPFEGRLLRRGLPSHTELAVVAIALTVLAAAVFGSHVANGGFYSDDWSIGAAYEFAPAPRMSNAADFIRSVLGSRPVMWLAYPLPHAAFGSHASWHLALAVALGVLTSLCLYRLLRELDLEPLHASIIAALVLVFPWSDSTRLWGIAGVNQLAVCLYLVGAVVALRGLRVRGRRAVALHAVAVALFAASLLTYEGLAGVVVFSGLLYIWRADWHDAWRRWLADLITAGVVLAWASSASTRPRPGFAEYLDDAPHFVRQSLSLLEDAVRPFDVTTWVPAALAAILLVLALRGREVSMANHAEVARWARIAAAAALAVAAAYAPFVGSGLHPADAGLNNRVNIVAALPMVVLVYATVLAASAAAGRGGRRSAALAGALLAALALGFVHRVRGDVVDWDRAASLQQRLLSSLERAIPRPPHGSTIYSFGFPADSHPGVSVFSQTWDLAGAVRLRWHDRSLNAYPIVVGTSFVCLPDSLYPSAAPGLRYDVVHGGYNRAHGGRYGRAFLVDVPTARAYAPRDAASCRALSATLRPGPVVGDPLPSR